MNPGYFTKTIQFQDINYQLNQNEDKTAIFEGWCDFLNYFDSSVKFQLSFMNMAANKETYGQNIAIPPQDDDFDNIEPEEAGYYACDGERCCEFCESYYPPTDDSKDEADEDEDFEKMMSALTSVIHEHFGSNVTIHIVFD